VPLDQTSVEYPDRIFFTSVFNVMNLSHASLHFRRVCEKDLDKVLNEGSNRFILDYSLSIFMNDRNLRLIMY